MGQIVTSSGIVVDPGILLGADPRAGIRHHDRRRLFDVLSVEAECRKYQESRLFSRFPDTGPFPRAEYIKHLRFFRRGAIKHIRLFLAANRIGKTEAALYEDTLHLTGLYPHWWEGRRFQYPIRAWCASDKARTTRNIMQFALLGERQQLGTGLIPASHLIRTTAKHGASDAVEIAYVRHVSGGVSRLEFKLFEEGVDAFKGTAQHLIHLDEEPPLNVYTECVARIMTTKGLVIVTTMPLKGTTALVTKLINDAWNKHELPDEVIAA